MLDLHEAPVVTALCKEPEGDIIRKVSPMQLTPSNLKTFWEKSKPFRTLFTDEINGDYKKFLELFLSMDGDNIRAHGLFWVVDDFVGIFYMTHITTLDAQCHFTFFDRRLKGREQMAKEIIRYVFKTFGFRRMNVEIPKYASKHTFGFTLSLGFVKEGEKRKAAHYKDDWFDVVCFGLLREEALPDGTPN
jgi:hypothetical protein